MTERESRLAGYRKRRDQFFGQHPHSPLSDEQKSWFRGLDYFPEREDLALILELDDSGEDVDEEITLATTDGLQKDFVRAGVVRFEVDSEPFTLTVLRDGRHGSLFLPFRDANAGVETYDVGRYLEPNPVPALVLYGPEDHVVPPSFPAKCKVAFTECVGPFEIAGAGHFLQWEAADTFNRALSHFFL